MRKLSILPALKHVLKLISDHWQVAAKWSLPWLALSAALNAWALFTKNPNPNLEISFSNSGVEALLLLVGFIGSSSIAVSWHRFILNDEPPSQVKPFRFDKTVWNFIKRSIAIGVICVVPMLLLSELFQRLPSIFLPLWLVLTLFLLVIMTRLSVSLVATAIERNDVSFKTSLLASRGNDFQILGLLIATLLMMFISMLAFIVLMTVAQNLSPKLALHASVLLGIPLQFVLILLNSSLQTSLYGYFIENREF